MRIIRRFAPVFALLSAVLVFAGCASGPSQASSAAIVGQRSIPLEDVQREINWLLANVPQARQMAENRKFDNFARKVVGERIVHELLALAAQREGLEVEQNSVTEMIESSGGTEEAAKLVGAEPKRLRQLAADQILLQKLAERNLSAVSIDLVGALVTGESPGSTAKDQAMALGEQIAADPAKARSLAGEGGRQVIEQRLALSEVLGSDSAALASSALFGVKPGTVVVIQPNPEQGSAWLVALVKDRNVDESAKKAGSPGEADPNTLYGIGLRMLAPIAEEVGVRVNPRYGVWDQAAMTLAANEQELSGRLIPVRTARP